jgi:hypothetical protein
MGTGTACGADTGAAAGRAGGGNTAIGAIGVAWNDGTAPALRTRSFNPSRSSSNSARSCSRTSARIRSMSENSINA